MNEIKNAVAVRNANNEACIHVFNLDEKLYNELLLCRKKLLDLEATIQGTINIEYENGEIFTYNLRGNIARGIEKEERDVSDSGLVYLAIHDSNFSRKVSEEFNRHQTSFDRYLSNVDYGFTKLDYFIKQFGVRMRFLVFKDHFIMVKPRFAQGFDYMSYEITFEELERIYEDMRCREIDKKEAKNYYEDEEDYLYGY